MSFVHGTLNGAAHDCPCYLCAPLRPSRKEGVAWSEEYRVFTSLRYQAKRSRGLASPVPVESRRVYKARERQKYINPTRRAAFAHRARWTAEDHAVIADQSLTIAEMAFRLGRSADAIMAQRSKRGLPRLNKVLSETD